MKKIIFLYVIFLSIISNSCSSDSYDDAPLYEMLPIESVEIPSNFQHNHTYTINYTYRKPSTCHYFSDLVYIINQNQRIVAVMNFISSDNDCMDLEEEIISKSFDFYCSITSGVYTFKFWQGKNSNGEDIYLTYEVPVIND